MSLEVFEAHLRDPAPGFRCYASGDKSRTKEFIARIEHRVARLATESDVAALMKQFGKVSPSLVEFFKLHDGVRLYCDTNSDAAGIEFFPVEQWPAEKLELHSSAMAMGFDEADMPEWYNSGAVFGEIPHSGNYLLIDSGGDTAGQVFYFDHDDFRTEPIAMSFDELLAAIVRDPPGFLYECGCYARYSDSRTDIQWIPKTYVPNAQVTNQVSKEK